MIELRPEWANGLDGERYIPGFVEEATQALSTAPGSPRTGGAACGIDYALAAACLHADTDEEAYLHVCFIVAELEKARLNMRASLDEGDGE